MAMLRQETELVRAAGSGIIPEFSFSDLNDLGKRTIFRVQLRQCGVAIIRVVVTEKEALEWKKLLRRYIRSNPSIKSGSSLML